MDELEVDAVGEDDEGVCGEAVCVCSAWADSVIGGEWLFTLEARDGAYVKPSALNASTVSWRPPGGLRCTMWSRVRVEGLLGLDILDPELGRICVVPLSSRLSSLRSCRSLARRYGCDCLLVAVDAAVCLQA